MISILNTIKKLLGPTEVYDHFDTDIIVHINSAFSSLTQLGVGPQDGFFIKDETDLWTDFIQDDKRLEFVKTYIYLKVKLVFDPPLSSSVLDAMNRHINELERDGLLTVHLDAEQAGVGTATCGPGVLPQYLVPLKKQSFEFTLYPVK